jgi:hypothetical protein
MLTPERSTYVVLGEIPAPLAGWRWKIVLKSRGPEAAVAILHSLVSIRQFVNQVMRSQAGA